MISGLSFNWWTTLRNFGYKYIGGRAHPDDPVWKKMRNAVDKMAVHTNSSLPFQIDLRYKDNRPGNPVQASSQLVNNKCFIDLYEGMWDEKLGFLRKANQDDIAAVVGHEMAHCVLQERAGSPEKINIPPIYGLSVALSPRERIEAESDRLGLLWMAKAGFNPMNVIEVMLNADSKKYPPSPDHPSLTVRIEYLKRFLPQAMHHYEISKKNR